MVNKADSCCSLIINVLNTDNFLKGSVLFTDNKSSMELDG